MPPCGISADVLPERHGGEDRVPPLIPANDGAELIEFDGQLAAGQTADLFLAVLAGAAQQ
jgi:hypothetical protein